MVVVCVAAKHVAFVSERISRQSSPANRAGALDLEPARDGNQWLKIDWCESGVVMPPLGRGPQGTGQGAC